MMGAEPERAPAGAGAENVVRGEGTAPAARRLSPALRARILHAATWDLALRAPQWSAARRVTPGQAVALRLLALAAAAAALAAPDIAFAAASLLLALGFGGLILFRLWAAVTPPRYEGGVPSAPSLPRYTILCPMHREARMLPGLVAALCALDYPRALLDIKLVIEEDDGPTLEAARRFAAPHMKIVAVPAGQPRTKPKAMNYALAFAQGTLLAIYDAEDRPDPAQLRAAAAAFARGGADLVCVQAPLAFYNAHENFLTRCFALEYAIHFGVILPALLRLGAPIPLGGTSNHFRTAALRRAGGWDPFNVTEDADLGFRLAGLGGRVGMIAPPTQEEATCRAPDWIRQRSRWLKGYAQTVLVHTRGWPRGFDPRKAAALWLTLGGALAAAILHGLAVLWLGWTLVAATAFGGAGPSGLAVAMLLAGYASAVAAGAAAAWRTRDPSLLPSLLLTPFYWPLQTLAVVRALRQLVADPFRWEKTEHGVSRIPAPPAARMGTAGKEKRRRFPAGAPAPCVPKDGT